MTNKRKIINDPVYGFLTIDDDIIFDVISHRWFQRQRHFCNVKPDCVIENLTLPVLYEAPLMLEKANLSSMVCRELSIAASAICLEL